MLFALKNAFWWFFFNDNFRSYFCKFFNVLLNFHKFDIWKFRFRMLANPMVQKLSAGPLIQVCAKVIFINKLQNTKMEFEMTFLTRFIPHVIWYKFLTSSSNFVVFSIYFFSRSRSIRRLCSKTCGRFRWLKKIIIFGHFRIEIMNFHQNVVQKSFCRRKNQVRLKFQIWFLILCAAKVYLLANEIRDVCELSQDCERFQRRDFL